MNTPRTDAPESIYLQYETDDCTWSRDQICDDDTKYIRADLYHKLETELAAAQERIKALEGRLATKAAEGIAAAFKRMDADRMKSMVDRFLSWRLPQDFSPDCGISFDGVGKKPEEYVDAAGYRKTWPVGTNLLTAKQAQEMLEYVTQHDAAINAARKEADRG